LPIIISETISGVIILNYNKVEICGIDTTKLKVLSEKEKISLLNKIKNGDKTAREKLINGNLKLVLSVIQRFSSRGENLDDLFQVGCIGLIKAIDNFDVELGLRFSTYAVPMIIGEIRRYLRDYNPIRVSRSMRDTAYQAMKIKERIINETQKDPSIDDIAKEMGVKREAVVIALEAIVEPVSLYEPVYFDAGDTIYVMDQIGDNNSDIDWIDEILLKKAINNLGEREKNILSLRFMNGMTQTEVAKEIGISQAQVSRLEKGALDKIKSHKKIYI
jgi:RNA polymerase sporulation-specific sigma factor